MSEGAALKTNGVTPLGGAPALGWSWLTGEGPDNGPTANPGGREGATFSGKPARPRSAQRNTKCGIAPCLTSLG